ALWLSQMGAEINGFSLPPATSPSMYELLSPWSLGVDRFGDIGHASTLQTFVDETEPDIVIHMAAQALVLRSLAEPANTFHTNLMRTLHLLSSLSERKRPCTVLVITSDKVYQNRDHKTAFSEEAPLGGDDPYSASKACVELLVHSW